MPCAERAVSIVPDPGVVSVNKARLRHEAYVMVAVAAICKMEIIVSHKLMIMVKGMKHKCNEATNRRL